VAVTTTSRTTGLGRASATDAPWRAANASAARVCGSTRRPARSRDRGADRRELGLGLPACSEQAEARRARPGEVLRRHAARRPRSHLAEPVRRDHGGERPVGEIEQADDEREPALDDRVALETGHPETAVRGRHDREVAAFDREPATRHELDLPGRHPPEAVLDHRHRVARRDERCNVVLGQPERHAPTLVTAA
jgi:hypothetical protein